MLRPQQAPLFAATGFIPKLHVKVADLLLGLPLRRVARAAAVGVGVVVHSAAVAVAVAVAASSSARVPSVVDVKLLFLSLSESYRVDVALVVSVLPENRRELGVWS